MSLTELVFTWQGYPMQQAHRKFEELLHLSADAFHAWQEKQRWAIARYHYDTNPFYRKHVGNTFPNEWDDLPIITKKDLQAPLESLISQDFSLKNVYINNTSGSSGHPFFYAKDKFCHAITWSLIRHRYGLYGLSLQSLEARFYGIPLERKGYWKETLKDRIASRRRFPVFDLSAENLDRYVEKLKAKPYDYVYGYTSSVTVFARHLLSRGLVLKQVCPGLKVCIVTSEVCTPEDRIILQQAMGVPVVNEYGSSEVGIMAFEHPDGRWVLSEETIYQEAGNEQQGSGPMLVTSLFNKAFPCIKYQIGDIATIRHKPGEKYRELVQLDGRVNDLIHLPSGKTSPGLTFYYISRSILESSGVLKEFIIRQISPSVFVFDAVTDRDLTPEELADMQQKMDSYLEPGLELRINRVTHIERPASGKIKHFYSELS